MFRGLRNVFLTGLVVLTPLLVTIGVLYLFTDRLDRFFQPVVRALIGRSIPGLGLLLGLVLILLTGLIASYYVGRKAQTFMDRLFLRLPFVRVIYGTSQRVIQTIRATRGIAFQRVVLIPYPRPGIYAYAFVTGEVASPVVDQLTRHTQPGTWYYVFVPHAPNPTGGHVVIVHESEMIPLHIAPQAVVQILMSGGILAQPEQPEVRAPASAPTQSGAVSHESAHHH